MSPKNAGALVPLKINFFLLAGISCLVGFSLMLVQRYNPQRLAFSYTEVKNMPGGDVFPTELVIEKQNLFLPVYKATVEKGVWPATTKGVSYLSSTAVPGKAGNAVIYGHNWPNILGRLTRVKPGDKILVKFNDQTVVPFQVAFTQTVTPEQTHILEATDDSRLTIYTCSGFLDTKRFVVTAILAESA